MSKTRKTKRNRTLKIDKQAVSEATANYENPFSARNIALLGIGLIILIAGYYCLAQPASNPSKLPSEGFLSLSVAPVLLLLAYLVIIPVGILIRKKPKEVNK